MAEAAITNLVESASKLLIHHPNHLSRPIAENELRRLMDDLNSLEAFFREMAQKHKDEGAFREMERQIKEVVYDVEDTINACFTNNSSLLSTDHKVFDLFPAFAVPQMSTLYLSLFHTWMMVKQIKQLRKRKLTPMLQALQAQILTLTFSYTWPEQHRTEVMRRKDYTVREVEGAVFEDEQNTLFRYLMEEKTELDVISITGMRGLGKTTLAWRIFNDRDIKNAFTIRIWTHVSQKFKTRDILLNIVRNITREDRSYLSDPELIKTIREHLSKFKFLLVMDDVCKVDDWKAIKDILPNMGKVLITTCDNDVGVYANVNRVPFKLRFLTEYDSWELLQLELLRGSEAWPHQELKKIVKVIAAKCGGLPLQIVAVAGILVAKLIKSPALRIEKEWLEVSKNVNLFLHNESSRISDVVELSYSILPGDLKDCFLYMGVFPEDYEISVWTLTRLWIAEGFVKPNYGQSLEDKAVQNLDDLITKNLVMVEKINPIGELKTCRLHNMIRGFCVYKAREQNLFQEIKRSEEGVLEPPLSQLQYSRRLCVHSTDNTLLSQLPYIPRIRSFLSFNESSSDGLDRSSISTILGAFKLLKVLAIKLDHQQPRRLTKLLHLRFITLSVDDLRVLPESLSKLWNLQTLVVDTKSRLITIEANIWKMIWLRHLKTNATIVLSRKGGEGKGGENLQTLSRLLPECTPNVCERARNLKTLGIRGNLDNLFKYSLKKMHRLQKLKLVNESLQELHQLEKLKLRNESILHELLHYFPPNITRLTLSKTFLQWDHMSTLANIETLEVLKLKDNAFTGIYWNAAKYSFPRLGFLLISDTDLVHWEASSSSLPNLRFLVLKKCENLNEIPWAVAENHLEKLDIEYVGESAVQSAKKIAKIKEYAEPYESAKKGNWWSPFKLTIGPGCY